MHLKWPSSHNDLVNQFLLLLFTLIQIGFVYDFDRLITVFGVYLCSFVIRAICLLKLNNHTEYDTLCVCAYKSIKVCDNASTTIIFVCGRNALADFEKPTNYYVIFMGMVIICSWRQQADYHFPKHIPRRDKPNNILFEIEFNERVHYESNK